MTWTDAAGSLFSFNVSALIVDNSRTNEWPMPMPMPRLKPKTQTETQAQAQAYCQFQSHGHGAAAKGEGERCRTAANQTVDHVWRRLPVNALPGQVIGAIQSAESLSLAAFGHTTTSD